MATVQALPWDSRRHQADDDDAESDAADIGQVEASTSAVLPLATVSRADAASVSGPGMAVPRPPLAPENAPLPAPAPGPSLGGRTGSPGMEGCTGASPGARFLRGVQSAGPTPRSAQRASGGVIFEGGTGGTALTFARPTSSLPVGAGSTSASATSSASAAASGVISTHTHLVPSAHHDASTHADQAPEQSVTASTGVPMVPGTAHEAGTLPAPTLTRHLDRQDAIDDATDDVSTAMPSLPLSSRGLNASTQQQQAPLRTGEHFSAQELRRITQQFARDAVLGVEGVSLINVDTGERTLCHYRLNPMLGEVVFWSGRCSTMQQDPLASQDRDLILLSPAGSSASEPSAACAAVADGGGVAPPLCRLRLGHVEDVWRPEQRPLPGTATSAWYEAMTGEEHDRLLFVTHRLGGGAARPRSADRWGLQGTAVHSVDVDGAAAADCALTETICILERHAMDRERFVVCFKVLQHSMSA
eukprot:gnl/TRDRNA2_/TRDRNA2_150265_c1_seq1.p1 gnl/TRDRNA2_/TRDRNA2_150265_c1~~gnl/TRDRNA2_/TRDRNA2_150265_c1_seq1.p1  ORF type:complete len:474 (-),score=79.23 gnl/TRDRNA2_/TRDRNA2_150265_c1_seq1:57-1478(-)